MGRNCVCLRGKENCKDTLIRQTKLCGDSGCRLIQKYIFDLMKIKLTNEANNYMPIESNA